MSGMTCYHLPWTAHTIGLRQPLSCNNLPWEALIVRRRRKLNVIIALGQYTWSEYVGYDMVSSPLESILNWTVWGVIGYHRPWTSHTIVRFRAWHARMAHRQHTWLDYVRRGMPSTPFDSIHGGWYRACYAIIAIGSTSGRMMSGMSYHHCNWTTYTRMNYIRCGRHSSPLGSIHMVAHVGHIM